MLMNNDIKNERHVVLITDDNYVMPTAVTIKSIEVNALSECQYIIHICSFGLSKDNIDYLNSMSTENFKIVIHIIQEDHYREKFGLISQKTHVTPSALIKFDLCKILDGLERVLYIDSDIIVNNSLNELFKYDIENYYLAASFEFWRYIIAKKEGTDGLSDFYFNSGVMLFNLKKIREDNISDILWSVKINKFNGQDNKSGLMDQDCFNDVCASMCYQLPIKFNFNPVFSKGNKIQDINKVYNLNYSSIQELLDDVVIIHYVGKTDKPWKYETANYVDLWEKYYLLAGYRIDDLKREVIKKNIAYYFERFRISLKKRGLINTLKYYFSKG